MPSDFITILEAKPSQLPVGTRLTRKLTHLRKTPDWIWKNFYPSPINLAKLDYQILDQGAWIEQDVDILIPAALENQINADTVGKISDKVKIIAEGANGPTSLEADKVIQERDIYMIPDFLANAGGVTCSYFEQVQCNMNFFWEKEEVLEKLDTKMTSAYHAVHNISKKKKLYMRDAAYVIAIDRVAQASRNRGWV